MLRGLYEITRPLYAPEKGAGNGGGGNGSGGSGGASGGGEGGSGGGSGEGAGGSGEGGGANGDPEELTDEEFEALPPKVKARIEKERSKAAEEAATKTKADLEAENKRKDESARSKQRESDRKKAEADGDKDKVIETLNGEVAEWKKKYEDLEATTRSVSDETARIKACSDAKLDVKYANNLGTDPTKYALEAKRLAKDLGSSGNRGPDLEGGNRGNGTSADHQQKVAKELVKNHRF